VVTINGVTNGILDGFTIQNGESNNNGGGILIQGGSVTLANLWVRDELEWALYDRLRTLFSVNVRLTFYDITSTFFYSDRCPLGKKGFSRDKRPDKEQIVIGVVTSYEGYPIKHYVFEGNTKDETTVIGVVKALKKEYNIEETTFVGDRGMISKLNLATIEREGFDYIMGVKVRQSEVHAMLFEDEQVEESQYVEHKGLKIQEKQIRVKDFPDYNGFRGGPLRPPSDAEISRFCSQLS
jgi:hypothetical protein